MDIQMPQDASMVLAQPAAEPDELRVPARLLEYKWGSFVAFPAHTTLALIDNPPVVEVPGAPYYCLGLVAWEGRRLPLLDLNALLRAYPDAQPASVGHVLVLAYQEIPGGPIEYGAVCARLLVRMVEVGDSQSCDLPVDSDLWPWIAMSCFAHDGHVVPVVDTSRLFAQAPA